MFLHQTITYSNEQEFEEAFARLKETKSAYKWEQGYQPLYRSIKNRDFPSKIVEAKKIKGK